MREGRKRDRQDYPWRLGVTKLSNPRVVVVTGASSGIGRAVVRALAGRGAKLGLIARNKEALKVAADEVSRAGGEALVLPLDVVDAEAVERAAAAVEDRWGPIDVWINNAMATVFAPVAQTTAEEYRRVTEVTYLGHVHGTLAALRRMRRAMRARSCRSARPWPIGRSRCRAPTAPQSRRGGSPTRCAPNSSMMAAPSALHAATSSSEHAASRPPAK